MFYLFIKVGKRQHFNRNTKVNSNFCTHISTDLFLANDGLKNTKRNVRIELRDFLLSFPSRYVEINACFTIHSVLRFTPCVAQFHFADKHDLTADTCPARRVVNLSSA